MKILTTITLFVFALFVVSCGPQVTTAQPTNADLSKYRTFAYLPNADIEMQDSNLDQEQVNQRIIETVNTQMQQEGYQMDRDNPDLLVLISVKRNQEVETTTDPVYATYPYGTYGVNTVSPYYNNYYYNDFYNYGSVVGYDTDTYNYTEGTLIISLVDRESRNTVWKGMTSEAIYSGSTTEEIAQLVDDIFDEYPIEGRARK
ncbi:uncharacterized protein DUF4136 [Neolewinella xylanilytica]|uniref:Uncharacterized protein DUF4136 n=1 Tax=Neolewinella xylanilytica TaxID=1514080 RepID=A0A2S6IBN2_9BACT|nr:DUF4136 domain-containing protein [Neolewinella xylanilytica]PPK88908.1 uncharacterized protein DUF4136 [Neolewinella xylanilytica]